MRELTGHRVGNELNSAISVRAIDERGPGNANHVYEIDPFTNTAGLEPCEIYFQDGPVGDSGVNGISDESVLCVLIDRLQGFQGGVYSCRDNAVALTHLETALLWLQKRTRDRQARGVEGTMQK